MFLQILVPQAFCLVKMAGASLQGRAVTSKMTAVMAPMKRIVGLLALLRMAAVDGRAPWLIILIGQWVQDLSKEYGRHMITLYRTKMVCVLSPSFFF